jgi:hypothetical protein
MTTFKVPTITTARLRLRAFRASDLECLLDDASKPGSHAVHGHGSHGDAGRGVADNADVVGLVGTARLRYVGLRENRR